MRSMKKVTVLLLAAVIVVAVLSLAGCGGGSTATQNGSATTAVTAPAPNGIPGAVNDIKQQANSAARDANLRIINTAIQAYTAEMGQPPTDISQLTKYLGSTPVDPAGGTYYIDASGNAAVR